MTISRERTPETDQFRAKSRRHKGEIGTETDRPRAHVVADGGDLHDETEIGIAAICEQLQDLQRIRISFLKSRIMLDNRLVSSVAVAMGYRSALDPVERKKAFDAARKVIKEIVQGDFCGETDAAIAPFVTEAMRSIEGFDRYVKLTEKKMVKLAAKLPVAPWVAAPEQRGFGLQSLAILVGECGDLANYANPGKLWRRMGCAPFESDGKTRMGATWKSKGGLSAAEWESFGYSPRRRSVAYVFQDPLLKLNFVCGDRIAETEEDVAVDDFDDGAEDAGDGALEIETVSAGPYRARYDTTKAAKLAIQDPEWPRTRCHRHALLLAVKLLLKNLWMAWNPQLVKEQNWQASTALKPKRAVPANLNHYKERPPGHA